jgi:hypothetical protein
MTIGQAGLSFILAPKAPWGADWAWGLPLIMLTVILHVYGLVIIQQRIIPLYGALMRTSHTTAGFTLIMVTATLLATCLHGIEAALWGWAYLLIGALPNIKLAMLYSMGAMTTYGHENLHVEARWELLGTIEALNGWLVFGLTTAFLFALISKIFPASWTRH